MLKLGRLTLSFGRSLRVRITAGVLMALALGMLALGFILDAAIRHVLWTRFDEWLYREFQSLSHVVEEHSKQRYQFEYQGIAAFESEEDPAYFQFWTPDNKPLAKSRWVGSKDLPRRPTETLKPLMFSGSLPDGRPGRFLQLSFPPRWESRAQPIPPALRKRITGVVARDAEEVYATISELRFWILGLGFMVVTLTGLGAIWGVRRGLKPAADLAPQIDAIDVRRMGSRLPTEALPDELAAPVTKLNELLVRMEASFQRERQFTADVSHELRTPLSGLRTILEVVSSRPREASEYREAVADALPIVHQMQSMIENLLVLARLDTNQMQVRKAPLGLAHFIAGCVRPFETKATSKNLTIRNQIRPDATIETDAEKLRIVLSNLLSNAAEYTSAGGTIEVRGGDKTDVVLDLENSGPPIDDALLPRIFDRFSRGDEARSGHGLHVGIGLSIARELSDALDLELSAHNLPNGHVLFRLRDRLGSPPVAKLRKPNSHLAA